MVRIINLQVILFWQQLGGTQLSLRGNQKPDNPASLHIVAEELEAQSVIYFLKFKINNNLINIF